MKKNTDQSLFKREYFPLLMNKVFAVYTASNFYKLYFQPQNMYYHSEVTLTSAKREHIPTSSMAVSNTFNSSAIRRLAATVQQP